MIAVASEDQQAWGVRSTLTSQGRMSVNYGKTEDVRNESGTRPPNCILRQIGFQIVVIGVLWFPGLQKHSLGRH